MKQEFVKGQNGSCGKKLIARFHLTDFGRNLRKAAMDIVQIKCDGRPIKV